MQRFRTPLIILVLGILPFWLFIGSSNTVTINGELLRDDRFNLIGVILAGIGLVLGFGEVRRDGSRDGLRFALILLGMLICLYQLAYSAGIV